MSEYAVFDTSVLIDNWRTNRHAERMANFGLLIRNCAVVLAELRRGATEPEEREALRILEKNPAILAPTPNDWIESGHILAKIGDEKGFDSAKLKDLHFDVLIALTVRSHGARLITSNRAGFELMLEYRNFHLEVW
jgi:predicted nucleic acid-binding protein